MSEQNHTLLANAQHISLMQRPFGPRIHMDENAAGAPAADAGPASVLQAAIGEGEGYSPEQALESLLNRRKKTQSPAESADVTAATADPELSVEDNADPVAEPAPGEGEDIDPASKEPLIDRPKSWTESEDAEWRATPRKLQEKIVARELERDTALRRTQNDAAEKLKGLTAKEQQAEQARQAYEAKHAAYTKTLESALQAEFGDIQTITDVRKMQAEDPFRFQAWQIRQMELTAAQAEKQQVEQRQSQEKQSKRAAYEAEQNTLLADLVPEMADPKKAGPYRERAIAMLNDDLGLKTEQLQRWYADDIGHEILSNAGIQRLMADRLELKDIKAAKKAVAAKPLPPVQQPGTAVNNRGAQDTTALRNKLNATGSVDDAFALFQAKRARRA